MKKILTKVFMICLIITLVSTQTIVYAEDTAHSKGINENEIVDERTYILDEESGFVRADGESPLFESPTKLLSNNMPSVYQTIEEVMEKYPDTRNQNPYGACWAFAIVACAEFDLIKQGAYTKNEADFSELQLIYAKHNTIDEPLGYTQGDTVTYLNEENNFLEAGSDIWTTNSALAGWRSLTFEKEMPYSLAEQALNGGFDSSMTFKNEAARLENMYSLDIVNDPDSVKAAIMDYGAVYAEYYHAQMYNDFYNEEHNTYFSTDQGGTINHAIAIVGWDDDIPKECFNETNQPSADGAWLIRNSWTTETGATEGSYFYMSYEDPNLRNCYALDFNTDRYAYNYQHDGSINNSITAAESAVNVFEMKNINNANAQSLDSVMITLNIDNDLKEQRFKVEIYTGVDDATNPKGGYLNEAATTYFTAEGYGTFTIPLENSVVLAPKERFAIAITPEESFFYIGMEEGRTTAISFNDYLDGIPWYKTTVSVDAGESYYFYDGEWNDMANYPSWEEGNVDRGNLMIKGLANDSDIERYLIDYNLNGGTNSTLNPSGYFGGEHIKLNEPARQGYEFLGWYRDAKYKNKITDISETSRGDVTVYAKWELKPKLKIENDVISGKPVLTWNDIPDAKKYEVYRATSKTGTYKRVFTTTKTEYTHNSAVAGKKYYYKVKVTLESGAIGYSDIKYRTCDCETPLLTVKNQTSTGKPIIYWGTVEKANKYVLYRATSKTGEYKIIKTAYDDGKFIDKNTTAGKKYYYKMKAFCKATSSGNSAYSKVYVRSCDCAKPSVSIKLSSTRKPKVSWKKVNGAGEYNVYRATSKSGKYTKVYTTKNTYYINKTAKKGKRYYYKVKAICLHNSGADSVYSKTVTMVSK